MVKAEGLVPVFLYLKKKKKNQEVVSPPADGFKGKQNLKLQQYLHLFIGRTVLFKDPICIILESCPEGISQKLCHALRRHQLRALVIHLWVFSV